MSDLSRFLDEFDDDGLPRGTRARRTQSLVHCANGHEWTKESTYWLHGHRQCRICADIRRRAYNKKHEKPWHKDNRKQIEVPVYFLSLPG